MNSKKFRWSIFETDSVYKGLKLLEVHPFHLQDSRVILREESWSFCECALRDNYSKSILILKNTFYDTVFCITIFLPSSRS